jgi:hypothetical protein
MKNSWEKILSITCLEMAHDGHQMNVRHPDFGYFGK